MKILHIISGLGIGGAENTLFNLVKHDRKNNHIIISLSRPIFFEKKLRKINIAVINFNFKKSFFKNLYNIIFFIKKNKPDVIQSWMYHAEFLSIFIKFFVSTKILWNIRNSTPYSKSFKLFTRILIFINAFFSNFVPSKIISCSKEATKNHIKIGYNKKIFFNIPNGVDLNKFILKKKKIKKKYIIGCVARWNPQKDHLNLIKALNNLLKVGHKNWKCLFVGKNVDNKNNYLKEKIKFYSINNYVKLLGPTKKIEKFYNKIDFLVLPSKDGEGFPNVILEAYASGVPCISTNIGDAKEVIDNKKYLIKPENDKLLSRAILKIFNDRYIISNKNRFNLRKKVSENYSIKKMVYSYQLVWSKN